MDGQKSKLKNAPIVEAVLDIDCDMPPGREITALEQIAVSLLNDSYPKHRALFIQEHRIELASKLQPQVSTSIRGFQFQQEDEKQIVQVRNDGFSFNRLVPYTTLDDYLPEIERTWRLFAEIASPVQVRVVRLRYINRIFLPEPEGDIDLSDYFSICPRLPDEEKLVLVGFLNQHSAIERGTENQVNIILAGQPPDKNMLPIIFDITAEVP